MKNYWRENMERYRRMAGNGVPAGYAHFSSLGFLDEVIPRLARHRERPRVLELGTGMGPGAVYLAERGFSVHAVDVIPEAIARARPIAAERGLEVRFEVMDVTRLPRHGPAYDLVVDSYCLQGIVLDADRGALFGAVKARLHSRGCYLVSSAMYAAVHRLPPAARSFLAAALAAPSIPRTGAGWPKGSVSALRRRSPRRHVPWLPTTVSISMN